MRPARASVSEISVTRDPNVSVSVIAVPFPPRPPHSCFRSVGFPGIIDAGSVITDSEPSVSLLIAIRSPALFFGGVLQHISPQQSLFPHHLITLFGKARERVYVKTPCHYYDRPTDAPRDHQPGVRHDKSRCRTFLSWHDKSIVPLSPYPLLTLPLACSCSESPGAVFDPVRDVLLRL